MRIFSILFLMIYTVIMFHNSIPHVHTEAGSTKNAHQKEHTHGHHADHSHQHHHASNTESSILDRLLGAIGDHHNTIEIDHFDDEITLKTDSKSSVEMASMNDFLDSPKLLADLNGIIYSDLEKIVFESPPVLYEHSKYNSSSLRGPPQYS